MGRRLLWGALFLLLLALPAGGEEKVLRWAGDSEGGVPFMFNDPKDVKRLIGFEVDIVEAVAKILGRRPVFVNNSWDNLIPGLERKLYDVAINGLEVTPEHEQEVAFSIPYYFTFLQIAVRRDNQDIQKLEDLRGKVAGTLKQSYSYFVLKDLGKVDIRSYIVEANAYEDLANGRLDGTLFDAPIALYSAGFNPEVKFVGPPVGEIRYAMALRKEDKALLGEINAALVQLRDSGELRRIYDKWNLWNPLMAKEWNDFSPRKVATSAYDDWAEAHRPHLTLQKRLERYAGFLPIFGEAAVVTLKVSVTAMLLAMALGFLLAVIRVFGPKWASALAVAYIEAIRGTPVLIQLFFIFYGLPNVGIKLSPFLAGALGLGLNYAAYEAENYRAGLLAVPRGQMEAALGLSMTRWQALRHVVIPQAFRVVIPPVTNDFISLLKDSSLVSIITMVDLTKAYGQIAATYYDYFGTGIMVAAIYLLLGLPFVRLSRWAERRFSVQDREKQRHHENLMRGGWR